MKVRIYLGGTQPCNTDGEHSLLGVFDLPSLPHMYERFAFELPESEAHLESVKEEGCLSYRVLDVNHVIDADGTYSGWLIVGDHCDREPTKEERQETESELQAIQRRHNVKARS
jgi:hypothetical protein